MANDSKKYVSLTRLSNFLDNIKTKYSQIGHKHTISDLTNYKVDTALSSTSTNPVQNKVIDAEFEAVSTAMGALDLAIDGKADVSHNHDSAYDVKGSAADALTSANEYTDAVLSGVEEGVSSILTGMYGEDLTEDGVPTIREIANDESSTALEAAKSYTDSVIKDKADASHNHDDRYYTESEIDTKLSGKSDKTHNHDSAYDVKGSAAAVQVNLDAVSDTVDAHIGNTNVHVTTTNKSNWNSAYTHSTSTHARTDATKVADSSTNGNILINGTETNVYTHPNSGVTAGTYKSVTVNAQGHITGGSNPTTLSGYGITDAESKGAASSALASAKEYTDTVASGKSDTGHNHDSAYDTKGAASNALASAKTYADSAATTAANKVKNDLLNGAGTAYDTLKELGDLIVGNQDAIDALETVASGKADKTHSHAIADVSGLQSALDGKAASSHGTHVSYSSTAPVMDGTASVGSASTVARSDHKHPTDTSRAAKTDLDSHTSNTTVHITSTERTNWNAAKTHADSAHAPSNAQANQNAFSNIKVGSTTIAADTTTDTLELVGSNVTITPDATNDKVTIAVADGTTSAKGVVQLTNSTSSTSTTTAATPSSVKSAYDLANTAKTNAATAQTRADSAYTLAEGKVDSLSDLGITATATELNYVDGVTSSIQTQLDAKAASVHNHIYYGVCSTAAGTAAKTVTVDNFSLVTGAMVIVKFSEANSASSPTLNVNSTGAKPIYRYGTTAASTSSSTSGWRAGAVQIFVYDGTGWIRDFWENSTYSNVSLGQGYATCSTAASTVAKTVTLSSYSLSTGGIVSIKFTNAVPANATLNINSKGAKSIYYRGAAITADIIKAGDVATFIYSSQYHLISIDRWQQDIDGKAGKKVEGQTITVGDVAYVGGVNAEVFNDYEANVATGAYSHAEGCYNKASGDYSHAEGAVTVSSGYAGHAEGYQTKASGSASHAEGKNTAAVGQCTHAEGVGSTLVPDTITYDSSISTVETAWNSAKFTLARGIGAHAEGSNTLALSTNDHSEGYETIAKGGSSHAQGYRTKATGGRAHAEGQYSLASGNDSHAEGTYTIAAGASQHAQGKYNVEDAAGKYAHIVGGGSSTSNRSNINTLDWSGNAWFKGDIYVGGTGQDDANAVKICTEKYVEDALANVTNSIAIPSYWQTELDNGVDAINAALETAGRNKSAFLWYTDAHWGYGSAMSPKLLKYLHENTALNKVNFGGDFCNDYEYPNTGKTEEEWVEVMREYKRAIRNLPNHHSVIGNHDADGVDGDIQYVADHLYGMTMAYEETPDIVRGGDFYYYIDEPNEMTRYLYLNTSFCTSLTASSEVGQGQFVADVLASTPEGWHIVPISHIWFLYADTSTPTVGDVPNYCKALLNLFDAYNNRGSGTITIGSESVSYNFADKGGWVEFCIGGHTHVDYDFASVGGIPVILTATDSYHLRGSSLDPRNLGGTTDESSVSGIVADYNNHKIHVVRIGRGDSRVINVTNYESGYTNVLETAGYTENVRLSASSGYAERENTGTDLSGYIRVSVGDTIYLKNVTMPDVSSGYSCLVYAFNLDKVGQASTSVPSTLTAANPVYSGGNLVQFTITSAMMGGGNVTEGYIRINANNIDSASIITVNEPIE